MRVILPVVCILAIVGVGNVDYSRDRSPPGGRGPGPPAPMVAAAAATYPAPPLPGSEPAPSPPAEDRNPEPAQSPATPDQALPFDLQVILDLATTTFPETPSRAVAVTLCELGGWVNPAAFNPQAAHGGPMQLARAVWAPVFQALYGWTWEQVVLDMDIHFAAARHVHDEALAVWGNGWRPWAGCL